MGVATNCSSWPFRTDSACAARSAALRFAEDTTVNAMPCVEPPLAATSDCQGAGVLCCCSAPGAGRARGARGDVVSSSASSAAPIGVSMILGGSDCSGLAQCTRFPPSAAPERSGGDPLFNPPNRVALCQARSAAWALGAKVLSRVGVPGFLAQGYSTCRGGAEHAPPLRTALRRWEGWALRQSINPPSQGQQACTIFW